MQKNKFPDLIGKEIDHIATAPRWVRSCWWLSTRSLCKVPTNIIRKI